MTPEKQNLAIANAVGATFTELVIRYPDGTESGRGNTPEYIAEKFANYQAQGIECELIEVLSTRKDYLNDLNAMHEAVMSLPDRNPYLRELQIVTADWENDPDDKNWLDRMTNATAAQCAEAFLKTLNLWES